MLHIPRQFECSFKIPHVERDASALTLQRDTGHLWVVVDEPERLVEFTDEGEFVREVELKGFKDTEGLCHLAGDCFAIAEERKMRITFVEIPRGTKKIKDDGQRIDLDEKAKGNKGLEGLAYDSGTDTLFAVREGDPRTVFRIQPLLANHERQIRQRPLDWRGLEDLSDLFFDESSGWLWLLSHESRRAVAFDSKGSRVAEWSLKEGQLGLPEDVQQAEGITRDRNGRWLICSEPNRIYRFV
jgi:uncharacterized protein YjiK